MIADTLDLTIQLVESYQREHPEIYQDYEWLIGELKCHMAKVSNCLMVTEKN